MAPRDRPYGPSDFLMDLGEIASDGLQASSEEVGAIGAVIAVSE